MVDDFITYVNNERVKSTIHPLVNNSRYFFLFFQWNKIACVSYLIQYVIKKLSTFEEKLWLSIFDEHMCTFIFFWTACIEGRYGLNCSRQCVGHCRDGMSCNHVTGLCDGGCTKGWRGDMCENGNTFFNIKVSCWIFRTCPLYL